MILPSEVGLTEEVRACARARRIGRLRVTPRAWGTTVTATIGIGILGCSSVSPIEADLALVNVNVVDIETGEIAAAQTVLIRDRDIVAVGPADAVNLDASARIHDGEGQYLIPGLWDAHVHFRGGPSLEEDNRALLPLYIANGVTTVRDAGGDMTSAVMAWRDSIRRGELVGPDIFTPGPKLDGPTGGWDGSIRLTDPSQVPAAIDSLEALRVDYVKIYDGSVSASVYLAIVEETERRGMLVTGHMPFTVNFGDAVDRGLDASEHLYYAFKGSAPNEADVTTRVSDGELSFWPALDELMAVWDAAGSREMFERMSAAGTAVVPTLHVGRVLAEVADANHDEDPQLRYIAPAVVETYAGRVASARAATGAARSRRARLGEFFREMIPLMRDAGVTFLAGSDAGPFNSYVYPGFSLHDELEELVAAGLTPREALEAATIAPARFLRQEDRLGRVVEGYQADLVLLERNPLEDITATREITAVIHLGELFDRERLLGLLDGVSRR